MKRLGLLLMAIFAMFATVNAHAATVTSTNVVNFITTTDPGSFELTFQYTGQVGDWVVGTYDDVNDIFTQFSEPSFVLNLGTSIMEIKTIDFNEGIINFAIKNNSNVWYLSEEDHPHTVLFSGENTIFGPGYYDQIIIDWNTESSAGISFELANANNKNSAFAPVPIPATALLFCSSILGIVGIRRKISK